LSHSIAQKDAEKLPQKLPQGVQTPFLSSVFAPFARDDNNLFYSELLSLQEVKGQTEFIHYSFFSTKKNIDLITK
jgi:hypothetical protein